LDLLAQWIKGSAVCNNCKQGQLTMIQETDIEGLSSQIQWKCSICNIQSFSSTSSKIKFTGIKGEKPKSSINLQAVGATIMTGSTFKTLEGMMGLLDIPCMTHKSYDTNIKFVGEASTKLAVEVLEKNAKLEGDLAKQHGATLDGLNRIPITVSYDGNWAKRSYGHSYNSLLGGGWMFGFYSQQPVAYFTLNKYCAICILGKKSNETHNCSKNWNKSAKAMEPEIAIQCTLMLAQIGLRVAIIIGDEDATVLSQMSKRLPNDLPGSGCSLCDVIKISDTNHVKKILTKNLRELWNSKWKSNGLTEKGINHIVYNFGYAIKTNKNNPEELKKALNNIIPHGFGDHTNCQNIGINTWCKANNADYVPQLPGGKYLGWNLMEIPKKEFMNDLQTIMNKFTTYSMINKLAPCGSTQQNESIHGIVGTLASKRIFLGRSHQWRYRNSLAGLRKSIGPHYGKQIFDKLNIKNGLQMNIYNAKLKFRSAYHQLYKKKAQVKLRRNRLKTLRKLSGKVQENQEGIQYESGCGLTENISKRKRDVELSVQVKKRKSGKELDLARKYPCSCGKSYTTHSNLLQHQKQKEHK
jgi:hypothetical protein